MNVLFVMESLVTTNKQTVQSPLTVTGHNVDNVL
jgi:hypothetical protein